MVAAGGQLATAAGGGLAGLAGRGRGAGARATQKSEKRSLLDGVDSLVLIE